MPSANWSGSGGGGAVADSVLTTRGDLLTRDSSALSRIAIGSKGYLPHSSGSDLEYQRLLDPTKRLMIFEDWIEGGAAGASVSSYNWNAAVGTAGVLSASTTTVTGVRNLGIMRHSVSTDTGFANASTLTVLKIGGGRIFFEACIQIDTLNDGTNSARMQVGLNSTTTAAQNANGVYWMYDSANTKFQFCTTASSSTTATALGSDVVADAWYRLGFEINDDATSVTPYINGVAQTAQTTNIPATSTLLHLSACWGKTAGSGTLLLYNDYIFYDQLFSGNRHT